MRSNRMPLWAMFLLLFQTLAYGQSTELEVIDFQLRWTHQFQFAGYYAAVEKGFYLSRPNSGLGVSTCLALLGVG